MLISVILPIFNMEKYLCRCVDSLLFQTYTNLEIILVNDGSSDSSAVICDSYAQKDDRIKVIHKKNGGVSTARNAGLDNATGDYISFVDPDDWVELNAYEILVKHLCAVEGDKPDVVRFNAYINGQILNPIPFCGEYKGENLKKNFVPAMVGSETYGGMFIMGVVWLCLYRKEFVDKHNFRYVLHDRLEDRLFSITVFFHAKFVLFVDDVLYHYTVNESSLSNRHDSEQWNRVLAFIVELENECAKLGLFSGELLNRFNNDVLLRAVMAVHHQFFTNNPNGFYYKYSMVKQILTNPFVVKASKNIRKDKVTKKDSLILFFIKHRCTLLLSVFELFVIVVNKLKRKNG